MSSFTDNSEIFTEYPLKLLESIRCLLRNGFLIDEISELRYTIKSLCSLQLEKICTSDWDQIQPPPQAPRFSFCNKARTKRARSARDHGKEKGRERDDVSLPFAHVPKHKREASGYEAGSNLFGNLEIIVDHLVFCLVFFLHSLKQLVGQDDFLFLVITRFSFPCFSCFLSLLVIAGIVWKVRNRYITFILNRVRNISFFY